MAEGRTYEEQLPWLQAVDDEDEPRGISARKMLTLLLVVIAGIALVAATFFLLGRRDSAAGGEPQLIQAQPGPYKVKPTDPGGLDVAGESETAFQTSAGEDQDAQLDLGKLDKEPAAKEAIPAPAPEKDAAEEAKPTETPKPEPVASGGSGSVVQLGAFKNSAQAERAWAALSARFPAVAGMGKMLVPFPGGIRLRASAGSPADAKATCAAVAAGGENCFVVR